MEELFDLTQLSSLWCKKTKKIEAGVCCVSQLGLETLKPLVSASRVVGIIDLYHHS
jgi:hypothetical protein